MDSQLIDASRFYFRKQHWPEEEMGRIYWRAIEKVGHPDQKKNFYCHEEYGFIAWNSDSIPTWDDFVKLHPSLKKEMDLDV